MKANSSVLMQDTQILLEGGLLNGVEISANPLRMEDEVIDGDRMDYYMAIIRKP